MKEKKMEAKGVNSGPNFTIGKLQKEKRGEDSQCLDHLKSEMFTNQLFDGELVIILS